MSVFCAAGPPLFPSTRGRSHVHCHIGPCTKDLVLPKRKSFNLLETGIDSISEQSICNIMICLDQLAIAFNVPFGIGMFDKSVEAGCSFGQTVAVVTWILARLLQVEKRLGAAMTTILLPGVRPVGMWCVKQAMLEPVQKTWFVFRFAAKESIRSLFDYEGWAKALRNHPLCRVPRARCPRPRAYVALLHGSEDHFLVYALLVGLRLKRLCAGADRVLLCAGRWWRNRSARAALKRVYTHVTLVRLIHATHATKTLRHARVFTKIQALRLPYKRLLFLDLDVVLRADLSPLFDVQAPAGMHHGNRRGPIEHGQLISEAVSNEDSWCVNSGVMRLDPSLTSRARRQDVDEMVDEVKRISSQTMLPEQYFLVKRLGGWRHLEPSWNMEVGPQLDDPGFTWPRFAARKAAADQRSHQWSQQDVEQVRLFHFSGTRFHPWWYADLSPERTYAELAKHFAHRDPRRLVATAVYEWRVALDELLSESKGWLKEERLPLDNAVQRMRQQAGAFRVWRHGLLHFHCHHCRGMFTGKEGRWLLGWEGWWLCHDCIVGYVFRDEAAEETLCVFCNRCEAGSWDWRHSQPQWRCNSCWY
mmetsp:Transcript_43804/g.115715  ORF Transcript_43804/g.115715 Transcript_43804/m.115715 type:complete len:588 (-) Transcript_43804:59-1822(-)